jgi:hypothetical protein
MRRAVILLVGLLALAGCGETYYNDPDCSAEESWAEMERRQTINELEDRVDELDGQLRRQGGYP